MEFICRYGLSNPHGDDRGRDRDVIIRARDGWRTMRNCSAFWR
jgi:hypothetical protein